MVIITERDIDKAMHTLEFYKKYLRGDFNCKLICFTHRKLRKCITKLSKICSTKFIIKEEEEE